MLPQVTNVRKKMKKKKLENKGKVKGKFLILGPLLSLEKDLQLMWVYF